MILKFAYQETDPLNNPYWDDLRNHDYNRSFSAVREFIQHNSIKMKNPNKRRNRFTWVIIVLLPLLVFFSCKRKTYMEPQGATLSFTAKDSVQSTIEITIQQYADKKWKVVFRSHSGTMIGTINAPNESYSKLKALADELKLITGVEKIYLSAVSTTVKESGFSRLSYKIFNRHVDATRISDEQMRSEIVIKLRENGMHQLKVLLLEKNGKRQVNFVPTGNNRDFSVELTLRDGTNVSAIAEKW